MEAENLSYLYNTLENLKFEALANGPLEAAMKLDKEAFTLKANINNPDDTTEFVFRFAKREKSPGELGEYYFLEGIDTTHTRRGMEPVQHTFTVYLQKGYNAEQMRNMMQGRSVETSYYDGKARRQVELYRRIDFTSKDERGNTVKRTHYSSSNGFSMERELNKLPLNMSAEDKNILLTHLRNGDMPSVVIRQGSNREKVFLEPRPHNGNIAVFNEKGERLIVSSGQIKVLKEQKSQTLPDAVKQMAAQQEQGQTQQQQQGQRRRAG